QCAASGEGALPDALLRFSSRLALRLAGLRVHTVCGSVTRTGATRRLRERCAAGCFAAVFFPVALR
ncbi:TPA: hypothetical protein ACK2W9_003143, partial [Klebsiella michiganensis]